MCLKEMTKFPFRPAKALPTVLLQPCEEIYIYKNSLRQLKNFENIRISTNGV